MLRESWNRFVFCQLDEQQLTVQFRREQNQNGFYLLRVFSYNLLEI